MKNPNANIGCNGGRFVTQLPFSYRFPVSRELSNKPVSGLGAGKRVKRAGNRRMPGDCLGDHPVASTRAEPVLNPCGTRAEPVLNPCGTRAEPVRNPCGTRAEPVRNPC